MIEFHKQQWNYHTSLVQQPDGLIVNLHYKFTEIQVILIPATCKSATSSFDSSYLY